MTMPPMASDNTGSNERTENLLQNVGSREVIVEFVELFNRGLYFEAHEVLEELWLPQRQGPDGPFYKGLIQLAGAFVHVQKGRAAPAVALLKLAGENLAKYPDTYHRVPVIVVRGLISDWRERIAGAPETTSASLRHRAPVIKLESGMG